MLKKCRFIPRLETDRLILREITEADTEDLRQWLGLDKVHAFWGCPASRDEKPGAAVLRPGPMSTASRLPISSGGWSAQATARDRNHRGV